MELEDTLEWQGTSELEGRECVKVLRSAELAIEKLYRDYRR